MVRLTQTLCKYIPEWYHLQKSSGGYFKKQAMLYMMRFHKHAGWSQFKHARNRYEYFLKGETYFASLKSSHRRDINRMRIAAACEQHQYNYAQLQSTLPKIDIHLNGAALARLAIYEPKTFKSLVDIAKEATSGTLPPANFNPNQLDLKVEFPREFTPS